MIAKVRGEDQREAFILLALASHPELILRCLDDIAELSLDGPAAERVRQALLDAVDESLDRERLAERLAQPRVREAYSQLLAVTGPAERLKLAQGADPEKPRHSDRRSLGRGRRLVVHRAGKRLPGAAAGASRRHARSDCTGDRHPDP